VNLGAITNGAGQLSVLGSSVIVTCPPSPDAVRLLNPEEMFVAVAPC
jgi:hypothetical protein